MILMYHKVDVITPSLWWVSKDAFRRQIDELSDMGVVYLSDYSPMDPTHCVITFDDAYENVYRHAFPILRERGIPFEIFVNGDFLGKWNRFDPWEPRTRFCGMDHLLEMSLAGGRIQWHTRHHPNLKELAKDEVLAEISVPADLRQKFPNPHFSWFAYPYGWHTPEIVELVRAHFEGAVSVEAGSSTDRHQLNRIVAHEALRLRFEPSDTRCFGDDSRTLANA